MFYVYFLYVVQSGCFSLLNDHSNENYWELVSWRAVCSSLCKLTDFPHNVNTVAELIFIHFKFVTTVTSNSLWGPTGRLSVLTKLFLWQGKQIFSVAMQA